MTERARVPGLASAAPAEVSVVVVNFNGKRHLERCLPALSRTTGVTLETIVVDNASCDGSLAWLAEHHSEVRVLAMPSNLGFGEANRRGVAQARNELVALLNNDTEVEPGWLAALLGPLQAAPDVAATCSVLRLLDHPDVVNANGGGMTWLGWGFDRDLGLPVESAVLSGPTETLFPTAAAMLMRRRDFVRHGGFDPAFFMYHEDVDLGWRWWIAGRRVLVCPDSVVRHACGGTAVSLHGLRWRELLGARHALRSVLKCYDIFKLRRALMGLARTWWRRRAFWTALHAAAWNLWHLPGTLWQRFKVQHGRRVSDLELLERVMSKVSVPPQAPEPPRADPARDAADWIATPSLLPGQQSALGRLGRGWFGEEVFGGARMRWTCGHAECFLKVAPDAAGHLVVTARRPVAGATPWPIEIACNGKPAAPRELPGDGWDEVAVPACAGPDGLLEIVLRSPRVVPFEAGSGPDARALGVGVRMLRFVPDVPPAPEAAPRVSVIVPTFNRCAILADTLRALAAQTYRDLEVIVVDDGSTDNTWARLQDLKAELGQALDLTLLQQANLKPGRARNHGLQHATGELVLFLGDDIVPSDTLVAEHVAAHAARGEPVGVLGFTDWDREGMRVTPFLEFVNQDGQQFCYGHFADGDDLFFTGLYTSNISLPRAVLGEEPFHPAFTFVDWEDIELGYRLSLRGLRLVLHMGARARHRHTMSVASFWRRQEHVGRTVGVLLSLHPELVASHVMPPLEPRAWYALARPFGPAARALVGLADRLGVRLPAKVYRGLLLVAFWNGRRQARAAAASG